MPGPVSESYPGPPDGEQSFKLSCAFCGHSYVDPDNDPTELERHIQTCEEHPANKLINKIGEVHQCPIGAKVCRVCDLIREWRRGG